MKLRLFFLRLQKKNLLIKTMIVNSANLSNQKKKNTQLKKLKTLKQTLLIKFFHTCTLQKAYQLLVNFLEEI